MKKLLLPALLLLASTTHATITSYHWEGTVDSGNIPETTASGSFTTDDSAPINPDESNAMVTTYDGGLKNVSLHIGSGDYSFPVWSYVVPANSGTFGVANCPLTGGPLNLDDLGLDEKSWDALYIPQGGGYSQIFGKITRLWTDQPAPQVAFNDTAPTPEPSSFVLMGAAGLAALAFSTIRKLRRVDNPPCPL